MPRRSTRVAPKCKVTPSNSTEYITYRKEGREDSSCVSGVFQVPVWPMYRVHSLLVEFRNPKATHPSGRLTLKNLIDLFTEWTKPVISAVAGYVRSHTRCHVVLSSLFLCKLLLDSRQPARNALLDQYVIEFATTIPLTCENGIISQSSDEHLHSTIP